MKKKSNKQSYSTKLVRHEVRLISTEGLNGLTRQVHELGAEVKALAGFISGLSERVEDLNSSFWDQTQATEIMQGRLFDLAKMLKERTP